MKGIVLDYSIQTNSGVIVGDDQKRYHFSGSEWKVNNAPQRGMNVDFDVNETGNAIAIYEALGVQNNIKNTMSYDGSSDTVSEKDFSPIDWFIKCFKNYANFSGRARRKEYWFFVLGIAIMLFCSAMGETMIFYMTHSEWEVEYKEPELIITVLLLFATVIPQWAVGARRLHDINKSGWLQLLNIIPIVGPILLIVWFAKEGDKTSNTYGEPPK